jgi:hypothetical protein
MLGIYFGQVNTQLYESFKRFYVWKIGVPYGIRTRVAAVRGRCPRPLDEGDIVEDIINKPIS